MDAVQRANPNMRHNNYPTEDQHRVVGARALDLLGPLHPAAGSVDANKRRLVPLARGRPLLGGVLSS